MILHTGGSACGWISTRSRPSSSAIDSASSRVNTPTISPSLPITRTRGTRISWLRRFCLLSGVLILQSPNGLKPARWSLPPGPGLCLHQFSVQPFDEGLDGHRPEILTGPCAYSHGPILLLAVTHDQQIRHSLQRMLANLIADLFIAQIGVHPEALIC